MGFEIEEGNSLQLEGKSSHDRAWYDCEVAARNGALFLRFAGYSTDDEEPLTDLASVRFSSLAAEAQDCPRLLPGTRITGFKRSVTEDLWIDAEVLGKKAGKHEGCKCRCSFTVKWLETADAGQKAELRIGDICLLDQRSLEQHPRYQHYKTVLEEQAAGLQQRQQQQQGRRRQPWHPSHSPGSSLEAISDAEGNNRGGEQRQAQRPQEREHRDPSVERRAFLLLPPAGASGPPCALCKLPTLMADDPAADLSPDKRREFGILYGGRYITHWRCATYGTEAGLAVCKNLISRTEVPGTVLTSFMGGVGNAMLQKCAQCGHGGAGTKCCSPGCQKYFHLHCAKGCKVDTEDFKLKCPAHSVLRRSSGFAGSTFYPKRSASARQAELDRMRSGKVRRTERLEALDRGANRHSGLDLEAPRRTGRHANKRVRYNEAQLASDGISEGWQKSLRCVKTVNLPDSDNSSDESMDEGDDGSGILYADQSDDEDGFVVEEVRHRRNPGQRGKQVRELTPSRRTGHERTKVKSYAEEQEELDLKMEAYREAKRRKSGYEDTRCQVCDSKARGNEMLLCDHCDHGFHLSCLDPPLAVPPLAFWFCPGCLPKQSCEACGQGAGGNRSSKRATAAKELSYCCTCGALCHSGCMQAQQGGLLRCELCCEGLQHVEVILGCRKAGHEGAREYCVKFKEKGYRRCRWVTAAAALRMAPSQLQRFYRETRDAATVEPNVQEQWLQVERVVSTRFNVESKCEECLVKWRGLEYDKATWEPRTELEAEEEALEKFERRMALRVEHDANVEKEARRGETPPKLKEQPDFLEGVGSLKDYQVEGVDWVLGKLRRNMSVILGDEMGLGKTIQTAVLLQLARERRLTTGPVAVVVPLSTFGSWEREMAKWAPGLEVLSYSGLQEARALIRKYELGSDDDDMEAVRRKQTALKPRFHVMLTTYDVVIRDCAMLKRFDWSALVIDEGHSLKGQDSLRGRMLRELGAPWRLLLTGTPLQNNLRELLALLAFMADCSIEDVERRVNPSEAAGIEEDLELLQAQAYIRKLHAYLEPRMLRRMKAVCLAGQMPPKITRRVGCRMTPLQLQLYADVLAKDWDRVNAMVRNRLEKKSMNNILMRLRQACNHPYLLPGQEPEEYKDPDSSALAEEGWRLMVAASGKLTLLQQLLPRLLADGHRVLIFSQYIEMLDILEDFLHDFQDPSGLLPKAEEDVSKSSGEGGEGGGSEKTVGSGDEGEGGSEEGHGAEEEEDFVRGRCGSVVRYFRLDGKTKGWQRQAMMDSFNSIDCKVRVFLISTRAGSLGINLQTANTVVLYDPDFNPFVDAQAEGRAHRLGQEETVLVYQLFTASSVEERILALAAKKRQLEELVTKHLGRARDVSEEDIKSSVLHGWGNLMRQAGEDGKGSADLTLSECELARLLDRQHVFADDLASGADAATLLGEVRAGGAAALKFEAGRGEAAEDGKGNAQGVDAEMEAAMMRLIQERARKYEQDKAAKEELGRGRRVRGGAKNYCAEDDEAALKEMMSDEESPDKKGKGQASSDDDEEYNPLTSPGMAAGKGGDGKGSGENVQPNATDMRYAGDSSDDSDSSDSEGGATATQQAQQVQQVWQTQQEQQAQQGQAQQEQAQQEQPQAAQQQAELPVSQAVVQAAAPAPAPPPVVAQKQFKPAKKKSKNRPELPKHQQPMGVGGSGGGASSCSGCREVQAEQEGGQVGDREAAAQEGEACEGKEAAHVLAHGANEQAQRGTGGGGAAGGTAAVAKGSSVYCSSRLGH